MQPINGWEEIVTYCARQNAIVRQNEDGLILRNFRREMMEKLTGKDDVFLIRNPDEAVTIKISELRNALDAACQAGLERGRA